MNPLRRYLADEIAIDHVDGLLTRREAIRRLALLGMGARPRPRSSPPAPSSRIKSEAPHLVDPRDFRGPCAAARYGERVGYLGDLVGWVRRVNYKGHVSQAASPRAPCWSFREQGLNDWVRSVAGRLAGAGYSALAIDLLSEKGGTAAFRDPAEATAALGTIPAEQFTHDMNSGVAEIKLRAPGQKVGVVGFCFGGGLVWQLLDTGALGVSAAVPF